MANTITPTIITEGTQKATIHFYLESDGNEGEFVNRVIFDPNTDFNVPWPQQLDPNYDGSSGGAKLAAPQMTILQFWGAASWFDMTFSFGGTIPYQGLVIPRDCGPYLDFRGFSGVKDRGATEPTGQLLLTTKDFAPQGSNATFVIEVKKN